MVACFVAVEFICDLHLFVCCIVGLFQNWLLPLPLHSDIMWGPPPTVAQACHFYSFDFIDT